MAAQPADAAAFEIKGRMATLSVMRLLTDDPRQILRQLDARLAQAPGFFTGMPFVLSAASDLDLGAEALQTLVDGLRKRDLLPVGVSGLSADRAAQAGLGVIRNLDGERPGGEASDRAPRERTTEPRPVAARLVTQPVRSGQQIYARGGDLVVLAPVSAGAEVMADGHIHVYASLRGRALAGVQGSADARIFCQSIEAELVAIAGEYQLSEQMDPALRGSPAMVCLQDSTLQVMPL